MQLEFAPTLFVLCKFILMMKIKLVCASVCLLQTMFIVIHFMFYKRIAYMDYRSTEEDGLFEHLTTPNKVNKQRSITSNSTEPFSIASNSSAAQVSGIAPSLTTPTTTAKMQFRTNPARIKAPAKLSEKKNRMIELSHIRTCKNMTFPNNVDQVDTWQSVNNRNTAYVYSAFFVDKGRRIVIIGARTMHRQSYYCLLWNNDTGDTGEITTTAKLLPEGRQLR